MAKPEITYQSKERRIQNFGEVSLGVSKKIATEEARRCPQCSNPVCMPGCPVGINIPSFIRMIREGDVKGAYLKIKESNPFPSICGRICSAPCESACILNDEKSPIGIRALERYASDFGAAPLSKISGARKGKKVAIVGSGPSGLSAAYELALKGFDVVVFEALDHPGGVLRYGIPDFRIPKKVLDAEIASIKSLGVEIKTNYFVGNTMSLEDFWTQKFHAVLLATGAGSPKFMDLKGSQLGNVYYGEEFLMRVNLIKPGLFSRHSPNFMLGSKVVVIGSGNTALDCARSAKRFGRDVTMVFRRSEDEMRVRGEEKELAKEENIQFESLVKPLEILSDEKNFVRALKCVRLDYADDGTGKWELAVVPDSEFDLDVDTVILAIGHEPNSLLKRVCPQLDLNSDGTIVVDEKTSLTSIPKVFACGNVVTNAGPVVTAIASGKKAASNIEQFLIK